MSPDRVEVAQQRNTPVRVSFLQLAQDVFDHELGATVDVDRLERQIFGVLDDTGVAVDRGRGREDQGLNAHTGHFFEEHDAA